MTPLTLALVLGSAIVHSTWNLWAKQIRDGTRSVPLIWTLTSISAVCYAPIAIGVALRSGFEPTPLAIGWMAGSAVIHVVYFLVLLRGYRVSDLSVVYPVARGTGPLLSALGAVLILHERLSWISGAGIAMVIVGIAILTWRPGSPRSSRVRAGVSHGLLAGVTIAIYTLWDGTAVRRFGLDPILYYWVGEVGRTLLLAPFALGQWEAVRDLWRWERPRVLGIALLSPLGYVFVLMAFQLAPISHVAPVRELSILFGTWLGAQVLGERDRARRLIAAAAFAAGVAALALG